MKVKETMSTNVRLARPDQTIREAAQAMADVDSGVLPVGENDRLVGMITDRDIAVRGVAKGHGPDTPIRDIMTSGIICARMDDDVEDVAVKMSEAQVRRLPVIDEDDRLCGIVSLGDLARESRGEEAHEALEGVSQPGGSHEQ